MGQSKLKKLTSIAVEHEIMVKVAKEAEANKRSVSGQIRWILMSYYQNKANRKQNIPAA
jgi:hypothetical protein